MTVRRPALFLLLALLAVQADVVFLGSTLIPMTQPGMLSTGPYGYDGFLPDIPTAIDPTGAFDAELAWAGYFARVVRAGSFPFWNPYQGLGQPQLANYVSGVLYPINWLNLVLPRAWWDLVFLADWFLVAWSTYLFARVLRLDRASAMTGGLAVFATGFFPGFLIVRSIIGTVAWFPFLLYAIERSLREPAWRWKAPALACGTACLAVAGHPEPAFVGLVLTVIYLGARVAASPRLWRESAFHILPAMLFGGLLAAPHWLPFADYVFSDAMSVHKGEMGILHFPAATLALWVFPFLYGPINLDIWQGTYASIAWVPSSVTFLAITGAVATLHRPRAGAVAMLAIVALAAAKIFGLPIVNDIGRFWLLKDFWFVYTNGFVAAGLCVFAALGFAALRREPLAWWIRPGAAWGGFALAMLTMGIVTLRQHAAMLAADSWRPKFMALAIAAGLFWAAAYPVALLLARRRDPGGRALFLVATAGLLLQAVACFPSGSLHACALFNAAAAAAFVAVAAVAIAAPRRMRGVVPAAIALGVTAAAVAACALVSPRLARRHDVFKPAPFVSMLTGLSNAPRIYPLEGILFPDFAAPYGLTSVTNLENLVPRWSAEFFSRFLDRGAPLSRFYGVDGARTPGAPDPTVEFWSRKRYWDLIGVRYLLTVGRDLNMRIVAGPARDAPAPVPLVAPRLAPVSCAGGAFDSVAVPLSTYGATQNGDVRLEVLDEHGAVMTAAVPVDAATLVNHAQQAFAFPTRVCADGARQVTLRLQFTPSAPGAAIAAWHYPGSREAEFFYTALAPPTADTGRLRLAFKDEKMGVQIWENPAAAERALLLPVVEVVSGPEAALTRLADASLDLQRTAFVERAGCAGDPTFPADASPGRLVQLTVGPNHVDVEYDARTRGMLMLSDAYSNGWRARIDGRDVPVWRVDAAFRGVCFDQAGRHRVTFHYRPPRWNSALMLASASALGLAGLVIAGRRRQPRPLRERRERRVS